MKLKHLLIVISTFFIINTYAVTKSTTVELQQSLTPIQALHMLIQGNARYVSGNMRQYDYAKEMKITEKGQHPFAVILNCIDSRSIPDIMLDQGLGNIFVTRIAGNVADKNVIGSMEFATAKAGTPLIAVIGHTKCGAIAGACSHAAKSANLKYLLNQINPAVKSVKKIEGKKFSCESEQTIDAIAKANVLAQMHYILKSSDTIKKLVKEGKVEVVGGMHDISTGKITFFDGSGKVIN